MLADSVQAIRFVAERLGSLCDRVVFLGGATVSLLVTEPGDESPRPTRDVDVVVEVASRMDYLGKLSRELVNRGFRNVLEGGVICRWAADDVTVDIMPTDGSILNFRNQWYPAVVSGADHYQFADGGPAIRLVSPACFLATKLDAFADRGRGDFVLSHDLEDVLSVVKGRPTIVEDVQSASRDVRDYIAREFTTLLANEAFVESLSGQLRGDSMNQQRLPVLRNRLDQISSIR